MANLTAEERKRRLAERLKNGEKVIVNSSGKVETPQEAAFETQPTMEPPEGKMA